MKSHQVSGGKGAPALLVIPIAGLEEKEYPFDFSVEAEDLEMEEAYRGTIIVKGTISRVGGQYHIRGTITAEQIGECDRCLVKTSRNVEIGFTLFFKVAGDGPEEYDGEEDEGVGGIYSLRADEHAIALDDEVIESLRLESPMKNLCREACKGLCTACGADLNTSECECEKGVVDPRWSKLEGLFPEDSELN